MRLMSEVDHFLRGNDLLDKCVMVDECMNVSILFNVGKLKFKCIIELNSKPYLTYMMYECFSEY